MRKEDRSVAFKQSLQARGIEMSSLCDAALKASYAGKDAQICAFGSLVEGYGNCASDIDLYEYGSDELRRSEHGQKRAVESEGLFFDLLYLDRSEIRTLVDKLRAQHISPVRFRKLAMLFNAAERRILHIVANGLPITGPHPSQIAVPPLRNEELSNHGVAYSRYHIHNSQVDLTGMLSARDFASAHLVMLSLLGNLADLIAAKEGLSDPIEKWRMRKLSRISSRWQDQLPGPGPSTDSDAILRDLHLGAAEFLRSQDMRCLFNALALARQVLLAVDLNFEGMASRCSIGCDWRSEAKPYNPMPDLRIDAAVFIADGAARLVALSDPRRSIYFPAEEAHLLTLFDARYSVIEAEDSAAEMHPDQGSARLRELRRLVQETGLLAGPLSECYT